MTLACPLVRSRQEKGRSWAASRSEALSGDRRIMMHSNEYRPTGRPETEARLHTDHSHRGGYGDPGTFHTREETVHGGAAGSGAQRGRGREDVGQDRARSFAPATDPGHGPCISGRIADLPARTGNCVGAGRIREPKPPVAVATPEPWGKGDGYGIARTVGGGISARKGFACLWGNCRGRQSPAPAARHGPGETRSFHCGSHQRDLR